MEKTDNLKNWYTEYKEKKLHSDIKRCNTFAVVSGTVATLSSLIVAGNLLIGNGVEALQIGGSTAAMVSYVLGYSKMKSTYQKELATLQENKTNPKDFVKERLESLKSTLEIYKTSLGMDYLVTGSFYTSCLGHIIELINVPNPSQLVSSIIGTALSGLVATLYLTLIKTHKKAINNSQTEISSIEEIIKLEEKAKKQMPELIDKEGTLQLEAPTEEEPTLLQLEQPKTIKK